VQGQRPAGEGASEQTGESTTARRRRRRRRGRRGGRGRTPGDTLVTGSAVEAGSLGDSATPPHGDPTGEAAMDQDSDGDFDNDADSGTDRDPDPSEQ
jgi:hypothetical protein